MKSQSTVLRCWGTDVQKTSRRQFISLPCRLQEANESWETVLSHLQ